jgi:hypothetical protein
MGDNDLTRDQEAILRALATDGAIKAVVVDGVSRRPVEELAARKFITYETATIPGPFPSSHSRDDITVRITLAGRKWFWDKHGRKISN